MTATVIDSFENGFYEYEGISELTVPNGWTPAWVQGEGNVNVRPEYKPKHTPDPEIYDGEWSASIHTRFASHDGVIYRRFNVGSGSNIIASIYAMNILPEGAEISGHGLRLGIDPFGDVNHLSESIVWSDWWSQYMAEWKSGVWKELRLPMVKATSNYVTVFAHSKCDYAGDISAAHFDLFTMTYDASAPVPGDDLMEHIQAIRIGLADTQAALDALEDFVTRNQKLCIIVGE